MDLCKL